MRKRWRGGLVENNIGKRRRDEEEMGRVGRWTKYRRRREER